MAQQFVTSNPSFTTQILHQPNLMNYNKSNMIGPVKNICHNQQNSNLRTSAQVLPMVHTTNNSTNNSEPIMTHAVEPIISTSNVSPSFKSDDMPSLTPYPGQYNFSICVPNGEYDESKRKGQTCVYQTAKDGTHQLFTKPSPNYWRLNYYIESNSMMIPNGLFIRLVPVYGDPEKAQCILERCPRHKESANLSQTQNNIEINALKNRSVVLVEKSSARYIQDPITHRVCVLLPFESPAEGQQHSSINCQFACYNSCFNQDSGGRKTLFLIATLERFDDSSSKKAEVLGRQCIQFRSCACPSRDWRDKKIDGVNSVHGGKAKRSASSKNISSLSGDSSLFSSIAIKMGGKDALIRVLPALPGIDEAIDNLVRGYLCSRAIDHGSNLEVIIETVRQLKAIENQIIKNLTYDPNNMDEQKSTPQLITSPESQISPVNSGSMFSDFPSLPSFHDHNNISTVSGNYPTSYIVRPIIPNYAIHNQYTSKDYNDFRTSYNDAKIPIELPNYEELSERNYRA